MSADSKEQSAQEVLVVEVTDSEHDKAHLQDVKTLFSEYLKELAIDLSFQNVDAEFASMPGKYSRSKLGCLLLALVVTHSSSGDSANAEKTQATRTAGACIGLRDLGNRIGELKRLFVRPAFRKLGLARTLVARALAIAREHGFERVRLDTLASMVPAMKLYRSLGFVEIEPYYDNPLAGTVYFELTLTSDDKNNRELAADAKASVGAGESGTKSNSNASTSASAATNQAAPTTAGTPSDAVGAGTPNTAVASTDREPREKCATIRVMKEVAAARAKGAEAN